MALSEATDQSGVREWPNPKTLEEMIQQVCYNTEANLGLSFLFFKQNHGSSATVNPVGVLKLRIFSRTVKDS